MPDDVLVMGWGNHPFARFMEPPLSTLLLPSQEVARRATRRLLDRIERKRRRSGGGTICA
ncbi:substrate-binding domain-containing protein [Rhizobium sp. 42MFCr.1]|uniref:substrate-binding domain-containing protein n=1 Tax=Rhizobium sp. 42MFCr.1 TaxID=1048680 RepID=UPI003FA7D71B